MFHSIKYCRHPVLIRKNILFKTFILLSVILFMLLMNDGNSPSVQVVMNVENQSAYKKPFVKSYGKIPMHFEANRGQTDEHVRFISRGSGYTLFLTSDEAVLSLGRPETGDRRQENKNATISEISSYSQAEIRQPKSTAVRIRMVDSNPSPQIKGLDELSGKSNYFIGKDPANWRAGIPNYARVKYQEVYKGIDLIYYGNQGRLEYDFIVAPGYDPDVISLQFDSSEELRIDDIGNLILAETSGEVKMQPPVVYQDRNGVRESVSAGYVCRSENQIGFVVGDYDPTLPLVIDPVLVYSTYLGRYAMDSAYAIDVDSLGNSYITGTTVSGNFPTTDSTVQTIKSDYKDVFVVKLNAEGSDIIYATFLGGSYDHLGLGGEDVGLGIAVDKDGNAYVAGVTLSDDFPTQNALQPNFGGPGFMEGDAFVVKLNPTGSALVYSTYLGGEYEDAAYDITADDDGNAYVTGETGSPGFPLKNALQPFHPGPNPYSFPQDVFVSKINASGSDFVFSTCLGSGGELHSGGEDLGYGIAIDTERNVYITGQASYDYPTTSGVFQPVTESSGAFVTKLNNQGSAIVYSTFLGGSSMDQGTTIAVDLPGNAYVAGKTSSDDFPTYNAIQSTKGTAGWGDDGFVSKLSPDGSSLLYSTFLGGNGHEWGLNVAVDSQGNAYVSGITQSNNFPTENALQTALNGIMDVFVTKINSAGSALDFSSYLGGSGWDGGGYTIKGLRVGIALDPSRDVYIASGTNSTDFNTVDPMQAASGGGWDIFVAKIAIEEKGVLTVFPNPIIFPITLPGETSVETVYLSNTGTGPLEIRNIYVEPTPLFALENEPETPLTLDSGEEIEFEVTYSPLSAMALEKIGHMNPMSGGALVIESDAEEPITSVPIETAGIIINEIGDEPDADLLDEQCDVNLEKPGNQCTLRAAIQHVNAMKDEDVTRAVFMIPGEAAPIIQPGNALPSIDYPLDLDGSTQESGYVVLDGSGAGENATGLHIKAGKSTVKAMNIFSFKNDGIRIEGEGNNTIVDCVLNGNGIGRSIDEGLRILDSPDNTIRNNIISETNGNAIMVGGDEATGNVIEYNRIGTDVTGTIARKNTGVGVWIENASNNTLRDNVISGNQSGIFIRASFIEPESPTANIIENNKIGTNVDGTQAIPNERNGIYVWGAIKTQIRMNTISANGVVYGQQGIQIRDSDETTIENNKIGTNAYGTIALPNSGSGINLYGNTNNSVIKENIISGNAENGILLQNEAHSNTIEENNIGIDITGKNSLGNGENGIKIRGDNTNENTIEKNIISANTMNGVLIVELSAWNEILSNKIGSDISGTEPLGNGNHGVYIEKSYPNYIYDNTISANKRSGIVVEGTELAVNYIGRNMIGTNKDGNNTDDKMRNEEHGVIIEGGAGVSIKDNQIAFHRERTGLLLIHIDFGIVTENGIHNNDVGIRCLDSNLKILYNAIYRNNVGIDVEDAETERILIDGNLVFENGGTNTGIHLKNAWASIRKNTIYGDDGDGITVEAGSMVSFTQNNIFFNDGLGLNNLEPGTIIDAQGNWWGNASGPGGSGPGSGDEVSEGVDFANWLTEMKTVFVSVGSDTIIMPTGETDTVTVYYQNLLNRNDVLDIQITDDLGWLQTPTSFSVALADTLGGSEEIVFTVPEAVPGGHPSNQVYIIATSQADPNAADTTWFIIESEEAAVTGISIFPDSVAIVPGDSVSFSATGFDQFYRSISIAPVWSSTGGSIDSEGLYIAGSETGTFRVTATDPVSGLYEDAIVVISTELAVGETMIEIPSTFRLYQNYPNPFNPETTICYSIPEQSRVTLNVFNILGEKVATLLDARMDVGYHHVNWDGRDHSGRQVSGGIYICRLQAGAYSQTIRLLFLR